VTMLRATPEGLACDQYRCVGAAAYRHTSKGKCLVLFVELLLVDVVCDVVFLARCYETLADCICPIVWFMPALYLCCMLVQPNWLAWV
jgi:hypothetical protein